MNTKSSPSETVTLLLMSRYYSVACEVDPAQYQTLLQEVEMLLEGQEVDGDA